MRSLILMTLALFLAMGTADAQGARTACVTCHSDADLFDEEGLRIAQNFAADVHAEVGFSCQDCHGGNPDPSLSDDMDASMDSGFADHPYVGAPEPAEIPAFCGHCHSDPSYMRRFNPAARVDQETEYWTSQHGQALRQGDTNVATCIDCHGVHGIQRIGDPRSRVYPTNVAETCASCHADSKHMEGYALPDGTPLPVDQEARWRRSVHAAAMYEKEDLTAPTCNDCHGNHGAAPPGVESVSFICGQCHGREADLFRSSPKHAGYQEHNELISDSETGRCNECHEPPEPQATLEGVHSFSECATCHGNHGIVRPTVALLGPLPETPCDFCHEAKGPLAEEVPEPKRMEEHYREARGNLMQAAAERGLAGSDRFDWLVDQTLRLPMHTRSAPEGETGAMTLRPEVERLFDKFRIGKTHYTYTDPATGQETKSPLLRCSSCHAAKPELAEEPVGHQTASIYLQKTQELTSLTARAERIILAAKRGGVELQEVLLELDKAVDAQIALEVLVHTFSADPEGAFMKKHREGIEHASSALVAGRDGVRELSQRRRGLYVALVFVILVLIGLGFKIRQMSSGRHVIEEQP